MSESGQQDKTEDPTQRRLEDARKKGQVAFSREVTSFLMVLGFTLTAMMVFPWIFRNARDKLAQYISNAHEYEVTPNGFQSLGGVLIGDYILLLAVPFIFLIVAAISGSLMQNGINISAEPIQPKLSKISVIKGFGRLFSRKSFMEFLKGIIKITIVGVVAYTSVSDEVQHLHKTPSMDMPELLEYIRKLAMSILIGTCVALFFIAVFDFMYQKWEFLKQMRMSKQEVKDEYKQQEGDPHIKGKLKQLRMERSRRRMMAAVPTADVVVTNPIHYAVALKYEKDSTAAPVVVAKGTDVVAERIKQLANDNKVPIVRNPTLARSLHADCDLDDEVPFQHYQAVAEIISYVYKLKGKR